MLATKNARKNSLLRIIPFSLLLVIVGGVVMVVSSDIGQMVAQGVFALGLLGLFVGLMNHFQRKIHRASDAF